MTVIKKRFGLFAGSVLVGLLLQGCSGESAEIRVPGVVAAEGGGIEPNANPGLSWWSRAAIDSFLRYQVWSGQRSGFVLMVARDGVPVHAYATGWADIENTRPMTVETPMRFASMIKPVTAVAAMQLVEQGMLDLDSPVARYIPELANLRVATSHTRNEEGGFDTVVADPQPLVRHLLMFASGIGPGRGDESELHTHWESNHFRLLRSGSLGERIATLAALPLFEHPGQSWRYGWSADVLARVVEVASGQSFDVYLRQHIFESLGMTRTAFQYQWEDQDELASMYSQDQNGDLIAVDPIADVDFPEGGSGLVSTAGDYMRFALMLWNGGEYGGVRVLEAATVRDMTSVHVAGGVLVEEGLDGLGWGLGMAVTVDAETSLISDRQGDFWWSGFYGTTFFVSPETGLVGIVLSQNQPGPHSELGAAPYIVQSLIFAGL